jgi:hypothetical protein
MKPFAPKLDPGGERGSIRVTVRRSDKGSDTVTIHSTMSDKVSDV